MMAEIKSLPGYAITDSGNVFFTCFALGAKTGRAKLTELEARSIAESQLSTAELMRKFNVTENIVTKIKHKRTWRHLYDSK